MSQHLQCRRWVVVVNERSGGANEEVRNDIEEALTRNECTWQTFEVKEGSDAAGQIHALPEGSFDAVLAAGGDGTVMEAINGLCRRNDDVPLAIIPVGTANLVSKALGIPANCDEAIALALAGTPKKFDIGKCGDRFFALGVGLGIAEKFVTKTPDSVKKKIGPIAYAMTLLHELRARPIQFQIDDSAGKREVLTGVALVVANALGIASGGFSRPSEFVPTDGELNILVIRRLHLWDVVRLGFRLFRGDITHDKVVASRTATNFTLTCTPQTPIQIDGDEVQDRCPLQISVLPARLGIFSTSP